MIYYIHNTNNGLVKIGFSKHPNIRLKQLKNQHGNSLLIVRIIPGDRALEKEIHAKFSRQRVHGEWFVWCNDMVFGDPVEDQKTESPNVVVIPQALKDRLKIHAAMTKRTMRDIIEQIVSEYLEKVGA